MKTLCRKNFSLLLAFAGLMIFVSSVFAQNGPAVAVTVTRGPHPAWEGKAAGEVPSLERTKDDLKTHLLRQPMPDIWLEFREGQREGQTPSPVPASKETVIKVVLPPEAKAVMQLLWQEALKFDYNQAFVKARTAQEGSDRDIAWLNYVTTATGKLEKIEIAAPDGRRAISDKEADELFLFARHRSADLVKSAKAQ